MKKFVAALSLLLILSSSSFAAKPTDKTVLKDISTQNMKNIKLSKSGGTFSVYGLQRWWTRGVTYTTSARLKEFPNATQIVGAEARYRLVGENYDFDKLKFVWSEYQGIPMPSDREILELINNDIVAFVEPYNWNQMVSELDGPHLSTDSALRKVIWHSANSFTITLQAKYSVISSNTEVQDVETDYKVRFYRDGVKQAWKERFYSSRYNDKIVTTHKYSANEINAMQTQSAKAAEKQAQASASQLPSIEIPAFKTDKEAFKFIYEVLRSKDRKKVEAMFRAMVHPSYYVQGSSLRLNPQGEEKLKDVLSSTFDKKVSFADSYCPQIFVKRYQTNQIEIFDALKKNKSRISLGLAGGGYKRGKKVGQVFKINALEVWTLRTDDAVAQLKSWPFDELCAENVKTTNQLKIANSASQGTMKTATTGIQAPPKDKINWVPFKSKYLPISMKIIGKANEKQKLQKGKKVTAMVAQSNDGTFRLMATDFKQKISAQVATATHVKFAKNFVKSNKALIHKKKPVSFGIGKALDYLIERGSGEKKVMISYRVFSNDTVVYQAMYSQYKKRFDKKLAKEFIDSIKLE